VAPRTRTACIPQKRTAVSGSVSRPFTVSGDSEATSALAVPEWLAEARPVVEAAVAGK
jgi:hypothetical protein